MSGWSKARKIILIVILILAVIAGGGFYWAKKQVNNLVSEAENVPRQSVKQSIDEWFKLPTGSSNTAGEAAKEAQDGGEALNGSSSGNEEGNSSSSTESSSQSSALTGTDGQKFNQITDKYKSQLIALNGEYESRISGLLATAQSEYSTRKKNGSQSDVAALAKKYYGTGKALEAECDGKVYSVINNMESELERNNLPTAIVGHVRTGYEKEKNDRRKYYMGKALKYL